MNTSRPMHRWPDIRRPSKHQLYIHMYGLFVILIAKPGEAPFMTNARSTSYLGLCCIPRNFKGLS